MKLFQTQLSLKQLQVLIWIGVFLIMFFSLAAEDGVYQTAAITLINVVFYAIIIYGNILWLYPTYYEKGRKTAYVIFAFLFVEAAGLSRGFLVVTTYNKYFAPQPEKITGGSIVSFLIGGMLVYMLSFIFRIAIAYFTIKQQAERILAQKSQAELNLLKSQVQPHFLFNTLNNIYYEAYLEAPRTAVLIEKLSEIMRYFVDESPKEKVTLLTEISFLENYIALEKIRIRHTIDLTFEKETGSDLWLPPMLLMTFVENIFKHGVDKSSTNNKIAITLKQQDGFLEFTTVNSLLDHKSIETSGGFGIENLRKRLTFLYGNSYELYVDKTDNEYKAFLKFPVS